MCLYLTRLIILISLHTGYLCFFMSFAIFCAKIIFLFEDTSRLAPAQNEFLCKLFANRHYRHYAFDINVNKKTKVRNRNNQIPHLTQGITWESDKNIRKHHIQESQDVSPLPAADQNATMNRQESMSNTKHT